MINPTISDEEFITLQLWRIAEGGGETGKRAERIANERETKFTRWLCSPAFPCHHCTECDTKP